MVRRRALAHSATRASMAAYQHLWSNAQQMHPRTVMVPSMPEYWHSLCNKMGGALPRMAVLPPPEASSRRLTRLRRQMMRTPKEGINLSNFVANYMQQSMMQQQHQHPQHLQQHQQQTSQVSYQPVWNRSCYGTPMRESASIMHTFYRPQAAAQPEVKYSPKSPQEDRNYYDYPSTASQLQLQWQQQQAQMQQQYKQYQMQQQKKHLPISILKKQSRSEAGQSVATGLQSFNSLSTKKSRRNPVASKYNEPRVEVKGKPAVPPKPKKGARAAVLKKDPPKPKQPTYQHQRNLKAPRNTHHSGCFNFGKCASRLIEGFGWDAKSETSMHLAANSNIQLPKEVFRYGDEKQDPPKEKSIRKSNKPVAEDKSTSCRFLEQLNRKLDLANVTSTVTLTRASGTPNQSHTSLADKGTNTRVDHLQDFLKRTPQRSSSPSSRKLKLNELLKNDKIKDLDGNPMLHSLMQLVAHMCESREEEKARKAKEEGQPDCLRVGAGADARQKQYSVYLMVTSDEEEDNKGSDKKSEVVESSSDPKMEDAACRVESMEDYTNRCRHVYEAEHPMASQEETEASGSQRTSLPLSQSAAPVDEKTPPLAQSRPTQEPESLPSHQELLSSSGSNAEEESFESATPETHQRSP
ncbi:uncharacterized protein [Drosophila bipectinata]|uniref:uncharacterized protein isoform X2 n=1 Tax=Drosophila bipectinata TaxID=42026 RepID=UPI0038B2D0F5